ncbi:amidohydrolase [Brachybacterium aquaticum]|uniref:Amidohydrolase n=1 Tax=Brachybacterium aquaticum TaxID=1432564 RepID=A0A841AHT2_9MICO|nr:amidohydrolase [Brachybacterium aquaticum]MBB5832885.1 amidohydrolase [Brachybacterium aquaticum]
MRPAQGRSQVPSSAGSHTRPREPRPEDFSRGDLPAHLTAALEDCAEQATMHACGHDTHVTAALGAATVLAEHRGDWTGTCIALFQRGEEIAAGARSMVEDGLVDKVPTPDVCLGQHVLAGPVAGKVAVTAGPAMSAAVSMSIVVHGACSHGSMPHLGVDPVVLAAAIVTRIQTLVAREIAPGDFGAVTVGSLHAGSSANVIPDRATMELNFRAYDDLVLDHPVACVQRIVHAECEAAHSRRTRRSSCTTTSP